MSLKTIRKAQLAKDLRIIDESGRTSERAIADLLRAPLMRWGLSPKRAVLRYARDQIGAAGVDDPAIMQNVLRQMICLGECDEVHVGHESYIAPAEPRWMSVGEGVGVYVGVFDPPEGISRMHNVNQRDIVQRIRIGSDDDAALLHVAGVREVSIAEWLCPINYLRHAARRLRRPVRSDTVTLGGFWELLQNEIAKEGLPLSSDAEVRVLTGEPGQFFGRHDALEPEGRWTATAPDGVWCAFRRGYGETHWHPALIAVNGDERRSLDLYDRDEWDWALLARGKNSNLDEVFHASSGSIKLTFPLPEQLSAAMDLLGPRTTPWGWELQPDAPDLWAVIK